MERGRGGTKTPVVILITHKPTNFQFHLPEHYSHGGNVYFDPLQL